MLVTCSVKVICNWVYTIVTLIGRRVTGLDRFHSNMGGVLISEVS